MYVPLRQSMPYILFAQQRRLTPMGTHSGCDNNRLDFDFNETWSLFCALDVSQLDTTLFLPHSLANHTILPPMKDGDKKELEKMEDEEMVVCDIPHQSIATSALTGYHLKIWVTEQSKSFLMDKILQTNFS